MARIHIVLVNWNGYRDTIECLESLLRLHDNDFSITVCDNGSTDRSIDKLRSWLSDGATIPLNRSEAVWANLQPERQHKPSYQVVTSKDALVSAGAPLITIVQAGENLGFAGGNNVGIRRALSDPECELVWLLNNDTVVGPNGLSALKVIMDQESDLAICGSTLLFYHNPSVVQALGGSFNLAIARGSHVGHLTSANTLPRRLEVERQMAYVIGASMMVRRAVFARTGGLSEDYFLYFEEQDLAAQLLNGERQGWAAESVIFHKEGGSIGTSSVSRPSDTSLYYLYINTLRFYRKLHPWLLPIAFARLAREALGAMRREDGNAIRLAWMAAVDFLIGRKRRGSINLNARKVAYR